MQAFPLDECDKFMTRAAFTLRRVSHKLVTVFFMKVILYQACILVISCTISTQTLNTQSVVILVATSSLQKSNVY